MKNCSFTGHRKIPWDIERQLRDLLARAIDYAYRNGCRTFFCGGAIGFDTFAAKEVIKYRILHRDVRLSLLLPCINQADGWSDQQISEYEFVLSAADFIEYVADEYTGDCMRARNMRLAEEADILIAYVGRQKSGSAQTLRMAKNLGKEIYNLYPTIHAPEGK